jgi:gluconolactonase
VTPISSANESTGMSSPVSRRTFLTASAGVAAAFTAANALARPYGPGAPPARYPDEDIIVLDERFKKYKLGTTSIRRLYHSDKMMWAEGPAWNGVGRYLVWSDIPNNVQMRWLNDDGHVSILRHPSNNSNGNTFDWQGRQISFEHGTRMVVRYDYDGTRTVLASEYNGKSLNAPNDGAVHPNGDIWFTDPGYGGLMNYEGNRVNTDSPQPIQKEAVYRIEAKTGKLHKLTDELYKPNGLCFSPDYKKVYVSDTGTSHYKEAKEIIKVWDIVDEKTVKNGRQFASMNMVMEDKQTKTKSEKAGFADGIRCDVDGNIWSSAGWVGDGYDGVHIFAAEDGTRIGQILLPEICSNVCFGGPKRNRLFMTGSTSLYAVYVETRGAHIT